MYLYIYAFFSAVSEHICLSRVVFPKCILSFCMCDLNQSDLSIDSIDISFSSSIQLRWGILSNW